MTEFFEIYEREFVQTLLEIQQNPTISRESRLNYAEKQVIFLILH